jgi:hypothetical protein
VVGGRWRWSKKVEAGQGRVAAVSWVKIPPPILHAEDPEALVLCELASGHLFLDAHGAVGYGLI